MPPALVKYSFEPNSWARNRHSAFPLRIELIQYGVRAAGQGRRTALVFDNHNCEYQLQQRNALNDLRLPRRWPAAAYSLVQWRKLVRYEAAALAAAAATVAVSEADKQAMRRIAPQGRDALKVEGRQRVVRVTTQDVLPLLLRGIPVGLAEGVHRLITALRELRIITGCEDLDSDVLTLHTHQVDHAQWNRPGQGKGSYTTQQYIGAIRLVGTFQPRSQVDGIAQGGVAEPANA